jgi:hypothetical protein
MAQNNKKQDLKKAFLIYKDSLQVLDLLTDEQAGQLFKAIKIFNEGKNPELDLALKVAFLPFQNQFNRDSDKYDRIAERNRQNGAKGGRPKKTQETQTKPENLVTDTDTKKETKKENETISLRFEFFWKTYDKKVDKKKCEQAWKKNVGAKPELVDFVIEQAKKYKALTPEAKYRKNPLTWINGECWNDELTSETKEPTKYIPTK